MPVVKLTAAGKAFLQEDDEVWAVAEREARRFGFSAAELFEEGAVDFGEHVEGNKRRRVECFLGGGRKILGMGFCGKIWVRMGLVVFSGGQVGSDCPFSEVRS